VIPGAVAARAVDPWPALEVRTVDGTHRLAPRWRVDAEAFAARARGWVESLGAAFEGGTWWDAPDVEWTPVERWPRAGGYRDAATLLAHRPAPDPLVRLVDFFCAGAERPWHSTAGEIRVVAASEGPLVVARRPAGLGSIALDALRARVDLPGGPLYVFGRRTWLSLRDPPDTPIRRVLDANIPAIAT